MRSSDLEVVFESDFQQIRPRLFGVAYRILGRAADAEDVVQDVWVRWHGADRARVRDRVAFLVTVTTRAALNVAVSAHARREIPVDHRLPERVSTSDDPTVAAERSAGVEDAVRCLLGRLSPAERAVFVLREAFDYPFGEIARVLAMSEANARQLGRRARVHLAEQRHEPPRPVEGHRLAPAFLGAARSGDMAGLHRVLVEDVLARRRSRPVLAGTAACGGTGCDHAMATARAS